MSKLKYQYNDDDHYVPSLNAGDKQEAVMTLRRELEEKFQLQRDDLSEKLVKTLSELSAKSMEFDIIAAEKKHLVSNLKNIQNDLDKETIEKRSEFNEFKNILEASKIDVTNVRTKLDEMEKLKLKLEENLVEKKDYISKQDVLRLTLEADVKRLRDDLARYVRTS